MTKFIMHVIEVVKRTWKGVTKSIVWDRIEGEIKKTCVQPISLLRIFSRLQSFGIKALLLLLLHVIEGSESSLYESLFSQLLLFVRILKFFPLLFL